MTDPAHKPVRFYGECDCVSLDNLPDDVPEAAAAAYEDAYYDCHFTCGDDFESCERAFSGIFCSVCGQDDGNVVKWPCEFGDPSLPIPEPYDLMPATPDEALSFYRPAVTS